MRRAEVPPAILANLRAICLKLPEAREEQAWTGVRWVVAKKNFAHVLMIASGWPPAYARAAKSEGPLCVLTFRTLDRTFDPRNFERPPFFRPVWFPNIVGMALGSRTDWREVADLISTSHRLLAPKTVGAQVGRGRQS